MKPLTLSGRSPDNAVVGHESERIFVRLAPADAPPTSAADAALIVDEYDWQLAHANGHSLAITYDGRPNGCSLSYVRLPRDFTQVSHGDVAGMDLRSGRMRLFYRRSSEHNFFLVTERCNNFCLMCSQPPKKADDGWLIDDIAQMLPLVDPATPALTFTGGEPLTEWRRFIKLLELARNSLPETAIHVLTNGRAFCNPEITDTWAALGTAPSSVDSRGVNFRPRLRLVCGAVRTLSG